MLSHAAEVFKKFKLHKSILDSFILPSTIIYSTQKILPMFWLPGSCLKSCEKESKKPNAGGSAIADQNDVKQPMVAVGGRGGSGLQYFPKTWFFS